MNNEMSGLGKDEAVEGEGIVSELRGEVGVEGDWIVIGE